MDKQNLRKALEKKVGKKLNWRLSYKTLLKVADYEGVNAEYSKFYGDKKAYKEAKKAQKLAIEMAIIQAC